MSKLDKHTHTRNLRMRIEANKSPGSCWTLQKVREAGPKQMWIQALQWHLDMKMTTWKLGMRTDWAQADPCCSKNNKPAQQKVEDLEIKEDRLK